MILALTRLWPIFFFAACANQLQTFTPATNFLTSEAQGKFLKTTISAAAIEGVNTHANLNETSKEIEFNSVKSFSQFMVMPQTGLSKKVDAFVKTTSHSPFLYGIKWQIFGKTE